MNTPGLGSIQTPPGIGAGPVPFSDAAWLGWDPARGEELIAAFGNARGTQTLRTDDLQQALMTALVRAEFLAAKAGLSTTIQTDKGPGVVAGSALAAAKRAPALPASRIYLATFAAVGRVAEGVVRAPDDAPTTIGGAPVKVGLPALVAIVVVALAALYLTKEAWVGYFKVQADADGLARVQRCKMAVDLAMAGKPIPPGLIPNEPDRPGPKVELGGFGGGAAFVALGILGVGLVAWARR